MQSETIDLQNISHGTTQAVSDGSQEATTAEATGTATAVTVGTDPSLTTRWPVVLVQNDGIGLLHTMDVGIHESGEDVMRKMVAMFGVTGVHKQLYKIFLFNKQEVCAGNISVVRHHSLFVLPEFWLTHHRQKITTSDLEAQTEPLLVELSNIQPEPLLTQAFHNPKLLKSATDFATANNRFGSSTQVDPSAPCKAMVVRWTTTRTHLIWLILLLSVLSLAVGVLVGKLVHSAELGVAVTSGVAAILSCVEVLMVWQFK